MKLLLAALITHRRSCAGCGRGWHRLRHAQVWQRDHHDLL